MRSHQVAAVAPTAQDATRELRVLAAEDNPVNQLVLTTLLGQAGVAPTIVADGRAALEAWEHGGPWDLILMDIQMPVMGGVAAAQAVRARELEPGVGRTLIIALTANAMAHQRAQYLAQGFGSLRSLKSTDVGYTLWISHGGLMKRTTLFQSNRSQAVRLPKDVAFPEGVRSVAILREGKRRVIVPADAVWDDFFDSPGVDLGERHQPAAQAREGF